MAAAAEASSRLLYESGLPCSGWAPVDEGAGRGVSADDRVQRRFLVGILAVAQRH